MFKRNLVPVQDMLNVFMITVWTGKISFASVIIVLCSLFLGASHSD
jgi:hypothetical protein